MAAAKPTMSPTTPPPNATNVHLRSSRCEMAASKTAMSTSMVFWSSPSGSTTASASMPPARSAASVRSRYSGATTSFVTTSAWLPLTCSHSSEPPSARKPSPMKMG